MRLFSRELEEFPIRNAEWKFLEGEFLGGNTPLSSVLSFRFIAFCALRAEGGVQRSGRAHGTHNYVPSVILEIKGT